MDVSTVLDPSLFSDTEMSDFQALADQCVDAVTVDAVEIAGAALDEARREHREALNLQGLRSRSLNALFKQLLKEVPRVDDGGEPRAVV